MQDIIKPIDRALLKAELTGDKKLRRTNKSNNEIYIITAHDSPNVMQEIGRLREIAFRYYGGGTGFPVDIDEYDTMDDAYRQLIVWSPEDEQILGGYRFLCGSDVKFDKAGKPVLATSHLFNFSDKFNKEYLPYTVELGRSFVTSRPVVAAQKDCSYWTIFGMAWELFPWWTPACSITSGR